MAKRKVPGVWTYDLFDGWVPNWRRRWASPARQSRAAPPVATHELTAPRIGHLHSWLYTQDEGWWRAALDRYGIPYTYMADTKAREGKPRVRFDVIIYPTVDTTVRDQLVGVPRSARTRSRTRSAR